MQCVDLGGRRIIKKFVRGRSALGAFACVVLGGCVRVGFRVWGHAGRVLTRRTGGWGGGGGETL